MGFDFDRNPFPELAKEFIDIYQTASRDALLSEGAVEILEYFKINGYTQIILSASQIVNLKKQICAFAIESYFKDVLGVDHIFGSTKSEIAVSWMKKNNVKSSNMMVIGDTMHDYEIAERLSCKCLLYLHGHQAADKTIDAVFIDSLRDIPKIIDDMNSL